MASYSKTSALLLGAGTAGLLAGLASLTTTAEGRSAIATRAGAIAIAAGMVRARAPRSGDYWLGCNDARAAGTAPIYAGEPGYREGMDGDGDGVACEPYR